MAVENPDVTYARLLEDMQPRVPVLVLYIDNDPDVPMHKRLVRCVLQDPLTCDMGDPYMVAPTAALYLMSKASIYAIDGDMVEEGDFRVALYDLVNSYAAGPQGVVMTEEVRNAIDCLQLGDIGSARGWLQQPATTCTLADVIQFIAEAHKRNHGDLLVEFEGATWRVL